MDELTGKILTAFYDNNGDEDYVIHVQDVGKTMQNHINHEKGIALRKGIEFTIEYLKQSGE